MTNNPLALLDIPLNRAYSTAEWDKIVAGLISLLSASDSSILERAIQRLVRIVKIEKSPKRLQEILSAILLESRSAKATQPSHNPEIFTVFCHKVQFLAQKSPYREIILAWLEQLTTSETPSPTEDDILAAKLFLGVYDSTWQAVGQTLLAWLDHDDLTVRASACLSR
ncbi:MAG: hypothetical protein F6K03_18450 [Kamptonema sp. SIO4C4]|nr:hypothetical protein [Kamptonema sp. SIO4C4]